MRDLDMVRTLVIWDKDSDYLRNPLFWFWDNQPFVDLLQVEVQDLTIYQCKAGILLRSTRIRM